MDIKAMVYRFLAWKLPKDFAPDGAILFKNTYRTQDEYGNLVEKPRWVSPYWPTGTNLLNADQAREMFEYVLAGQEVEKGNQTTTHSESFEAMVRRLLNKAMFSSGDGQDSTLVFARYLQAELGINPHPAIETPKEVEKGSEPATDPQQEPSYRNGVPLWSVCYCGMQMVLGATCSVCGYKCEMPASQQNVHTDHPSRHYDRTCPGCAKRPVETSGFTISIDDGYCEWSYKLSVAESHSIEDVMTGICEKFDAPMPVGVARSANAKELMESRPKYGGKYADFHKTMAIGNPATDPQEEQPFCWVLPGAYNINGKGWIDARIDKLGDFTRPLYTRPQHDRVKELEGVEMLNGLQAQSIGILSKELDEAEAKIAEQATRITHLETCLATAISTGMDKIATLTAQRDRLAGVLKELLGAQNLDAPNFYRIRETARAVLEEVGK